MPLIPLDSVLSSALQADSFFCDMFGTIWNGQNFYKTVAPVFRALKKRNKKIYILSNATVRSSVFFKKTAAYGLEKGCDYDDFITSGDALANQLEHSYFEQITNRPDYRFYVIGRPNPLLFHTIAAHQTPVIEQAHLIYISGLEVDETPPLTLERFLPIARQALKQGLPAVCANPDYVAFHGTEKYLTGGSLAKWYQDRGGCVYWTGKPYSFIFDYAFSRTGAIPETSLMIGDTLHTDIKGGQNAGMKTLLITKTGVTAHALVPGQTLSALCEQENVQPDFIINSFA